MTFSVLTERDIEAIADGVTRRIRSLVSSSAPGPMGLDVFEVSRRLGLSPYTVRKYVRTGRLKAMPGLPCIRITVESLEGLSRKKINGGRGA